MTGRAVLTPKLNALNAAVAQRVEGWLPQNTHRAPFRAGGCIYKPNGKRECARRRGQIARGVQVSER